METIRIRKDEFIDLVCFREQTKLIPGEILEINEIMVNDDYQSAFIIYRSSTNKPIKVLQYDFYKMIEPEFVEVLLESKGQTLCNVEVIKLPTTWLVLDENTIRPNE
jgi:hypothetical protein